MTTPSHHSPSFGRRWLAIAACALLAGGTTWVVADARLEQKGSSVTVKVDPTPLPRLEEPMTSLSPIVKRVGPSVVKVVTRERAREMETSGGLPFDDPRFREFFGPFFGERGLPPPRQNRRPSQPGLGSGVIVSSDGYILTNNHVVADADNVRVTLADGRELTAKVVGGDDKTDIAVIKVDATNLPTITFAESHDVQVGDRVLAVGNPFGLGQTVTTGIVSATGRSVSLGIDYADFIQTDAAINPGNSGGALVDLQGRLIGINTAILSRSGGFQGIGFAIPSDLARHIMDSLVRDGKVVRGHLGVIIQNVTPALAESFKLKSTRGAVVSDVSPGGPAARAGLKSGDVIVSFDGKPIEDTHRLRFAVAATRPGEAVKVQVLRDGKEQTIEVKVGEQPVDGRIAGGSPHLQEQTGLNGVGFTDLNAATRREFGVPPRVQGVLVTEVDPNSAAAEAGLNPGDVIQEINRQPVRTAVEAARIIESSESGKTLLKLWSRGGTHFIVVDESG